jgi:enoyl-CoA hydratase/carnithine racemase
LARVSASREKGTALVESREFAVAANENGSTESVKLEVIGQIARLTLQRPRALNAINVDMIGALHSHMSTIEQSESRVVILTGAGRAFCTGADLKSIQESDGRVHPEGVAAFVHQISDVVKRLAQLPLPVIGAINGIAMAGGLELLLACDLVLAASGAHIGDAHANYGLLPGAGGAVRLPRIVGATVAKYMMFSGRSWPAEDLVVHGLVNEVVPADVLQDRATALAEELCLRSKLGLATMKRLVDDGLAQPIDTALRLEAHAHDAHSHSRDFGEGIAAFRERRQPKF